MWLKYRDKWASGMKTEWDYYDVGSDKQEYIDDFLTEESNKHNWSDKFRGLDYEIIDKPPKEYLVKLIDRLSNTLFCTERRIEKLKKLCYND